MVGVVSGSLYRRTHSLSRLAWSWVLGRRPLSAVLHSSNEPGELSQWLCHDDSTKWHRHSKTRPDLHGTVLPPGYFNGIIR